MKQKQSTIGDKGNTSSKVPWTITQRSDTSYDDNYRRDSITVYSTNDNPIGFITNFERYRRQRD